MENFSINPPTPWLLYGFTFLQQFPSSESRLLKGLTSTAQLLRVARCHGLPSSPNPSIGTSEGVLPLARLGALLGLLRLAILGRAGGGGPGGFGFYIELE